MDKAFPYTLETGSKKHRCPSCQKKTFVRYVYTGTRDYVGEDYGRCDRENNCGYHKAPEKDTATPHTPQVKKDIPEPKTLKPTLPFLKSIKKQQPGNLARFCMDTLKITKDHLVKWGLYANWKFDAFVLSNSEGEAVNVKFVVYTPEGKRDRSEKEDGSPAFFPHYLGKSYLKKQGILTDAEQLDHWQDLYKFDRCFYGEHLFDPELDSCLVESEKTALIAAWFFPGVNWLATGGANGMKYEQFRIFHGYKGRIWNLVDNDPAGYEKSKTIHWLDLMADIRDDPEEIKSVNLFPNAAEGWDLADAIIKDGYRDRDRFIKELKEAKDCRLEFEVDTESGELIEKPIPRKKVDEKQLRRAMQVADRIFEGKVNMLIREDVNILTLTESIAYFGEKGRDIARKVLLVGGQEESITDPAYNIALSDPHDDPGYFFAKAKAAGVEVRYIKKVADEAAEGAEGIDANKWKISWPDKINEQEGWDEFKMRNQIFTYSFIEHMNCYYYAYFRDKEVTFDQISNFIIRPLYLIRSKTDPKRLFEIKNIHGKKDVIDIPAKALVSMTEFQVFCESQGNFLFQGTKNQFVKIKSNLYDHTKDADEVKMLGWQDEGFYAFANGAYEERFTKVDEYGIIRQTIPTKSENEAIEKYFFIAAMSSIYKDEKDQYDLEKKFVYVSRPDVKFADWAELFYKVYGGNGILGMSFYISSLFRDLIYSRFKFFPHLFHFGPPGTGKSTMCWSIQYMFGLERKPFMLNAGTAVGFHRTFAQFRNAVVWFDEYNNTIEFKRVQDLKSAYDGAGHVKGEWSASGGTTNRTSTTPVEAACNISGQELPIADNALFKRCILLQYHQTIFSDQEKELLTNLQKLQEKGLSHITGGLTRFRKKMEEDYFRLFDQVEAEILAELNDDPTIESRIIKNMAVIATTYRVLADELHWPWNWPTMLRTIAESIKQQNALISNAKETNQFWDAVDYCISEGELKDGEDYKVEHTTSVNVTVERKTVTRTLIRPQDVLYIRLGTAHPKYMEALRKQGEKKGMDKGSLAHYLSHSPGFIGMVSGTRFKKSDRPFNTSAYAFEYSHIEQAGYNFKRFLDEAEIKEEHEEEKAKVFGPKKEDETF